MISKTILLYPAINFLISRYTSHSAYRLGDTALQILARCTTSLRFAPCLTGASTHSAACSTAVFRIIRHFLFAIGCLAGGAFASTPQSLTFESLNNESGLMQNTVQAVLQDSRGFIWIGTQGGLHRFDSYELAVFDHANYPALPDSLITALQEDAQQRLWIATRTAGFAVFDLSSGQFVTTPPGFPEAPDDRLHVNAAIIVGHDLWFANDRGVGRYNLQQPQLQQTDFARSLSLASDGDGGVFVGTDGRGVWRITASGLLTQMEQADAGDQIAALHRDTKRNLWIGSERGLYQIAAGQRRAEALSLLSPTAHVLQAPIRAIASDTLGNVWISVHGAGMVMWNPTQQRAAHFQHAGISGGGNLSVAINTVYVDRKNTLWVGSDSAGVAYVNLAALQFGFHREHDQSNAMSDSNNIRAIFVDNDERVWLGTDLFGLKSLDKNAEHYRNHTRRLLSAVPHNKRENLRVLSIKQAGPDALYVGGDAGLFRYDVKRDKVEHFDQLPGLTEKSDPFVRTIVVDDDESLWLGTYSVGVVHMMWPSRVLERYYKGGSDQFALSHDTVLSEVHRVNNDLWVGTLQGLNRIRANKATQMFYHVANDDHSLPGNIVTTVMTDSEGQLWIGTHGGLSLVKNPDADTPQFKSWRQRDGLFDATIYGIREDEKKQLWLSSNRGIIRFNVANQLFTQFDHRDGLQGLEFNGGAHFRDQKGRLYFGGVNGYNVFFPSSILEHPPIDTLAATALQIGNHPRAFLLASNIPSAKVEYDDRIISVQVSALNYTAADYTQYSYRLQGFDREWGTPSKRREATYTNLEPGHYTLQVRAINRDGIWSLPVTLIDIDVLSPLWWQWWAKSIYLIAALAIVAYISWTRIVRDRERQHAEASVRESEQRLKWSLWGTGDGLWVWDLKTGEVHREGFLGVLGYADDEIPPSPEWRQQLTHPEDHYILPAAVQRHLNGETEQFEATYRMRHRDGSWVWILDRGQIVERDHSGKAVRLAGTTKDVTERQRYEEELRHLANYDTLTNLPNRTLFHERLRHALAQARRGQYRVALLFFDLDRFKHINDSMGHAAGDALLRQVAKRLLTSVRDEDTVARLGGDEFTVVLEAIATIESAAIVAEKILAAFGKPFDLDGNEVVVTPSVGISIFPEDGDDAATLIKNADLAMYHAKEQGRNNYQFFVGAMNEQMRRRHALENALRKALLQNEFSLNFQPKMDIRYGHITGLEALLRWTSNELGPVRPDEFIPLAEETGLIVSIGDWVIGRALQHIRHWQKNGVPQVPVAVNLSLRQLMTGDIRERIRALLDANSVAPHFLQLEITESLVMANPEQATARLNELREMGIRLAVDDFGTGYSSLSYLKKLPIDTIKIDKSFVRDITTDNDDATITRTIIAMAHSLQLSVVAEGVETDEQLDFLRREGCEELQGFWLAKPLPADQCAEFLLQRTPTT